MAVMAFTGGEIGSTAELTSPAAVAMETVIVRSGKYAYRFSATGLGTLIYPSAQSVAVYFRGYLQFSALPSVRSTCVDFRSAAGVVVVTIRVNASGTLRIAGTGLTVQDGTTVLTVGQYYRIEVMVGTTDQYVELRINGRRELYGPQPISSSIGQTALGWETGPGFGYWDDVHIDTDGWPGPGYVIARQGRTSTPTYDQFSKSSGSNIALLWSDTPFSASTSASSTNVDQTQTMVTERPGEPTRGHRFGDPFVNERDSILGCKVAVVAKRTGSSPDHYISRMVAGVTTHELIATTTTDALYQTSVWLPTNPEQIRRCEIGAHRGAGSAQLTVEDAWLLISAASEQKGAVFFTGLESGSLLELGEAMTSGTVAVQTSVVRSGRYALRLTGGSAIARLNGPLVMDRPLIFLRTYINLPVFFTGTLIKFYSGGGVALQIDLNSFGGLTLFLNGVGINAIHNQTTVNTWHRLEIMYRATLIGLDGEVIMRLDDNEIAYDGVHVMGAITRIEASVAVASQILYLDDIMVDDTRWPGSGRILSRQGMTGFPSEDAWTKTGATTIQGVWSNTPPNTATFATATAAGQGQSMLLVPVSGTEGIEGESDTLVSEHDIVLACRIFAIAAVTANGSGDIHSFRRRQNGRVTASLVGLIDTTPRPYFDDIFLGTHAALDTMEIGGVQGSGSGVSFMRIYDLWLMVAYAELEPAEIPLPSTPQIAAVVRMTAQRDEVSPVERAILRAKPILYFPLGEPLSSPIARDKSGHNRHAYVVGTEPIFFGPITGLGLVPNDVGTALQIPRNATTPTLQVGHSDAFNLQQLTILGWYQPAQIVLSSGVFYRDVGGTDAYKISQLGAFFEFRAFIDAITFTGLVAGEAFFFAFTLSGAGVLRGYKNGVLVASGTATLALPEGKGKIYVASRPGMVSDGRYQHMALYDRALSEDEVRNIYAAQFRNTATTYAKTVLRLLPHLWLRFNDPPGSTYMLDSSGFSRHGSYVGNPELGAYGPLTEPAVHFTGNIAQYGWLASAYHTTFSVPAGTWILWWKPDLRKTLSGILEKTVGGVVNTHQSFHFAMYGAGAALMVFRVMYTTNTLRDAYFEVRERDIGVYQMVAGVYDSTTMAIYKNGVVQMTTVTGSAPQHGVGETYFGKLGSNGYPAEGSLGDVLFFPYRLTTEQIAEIYAARQQWFAEFDTEIDGQWHDGHLLTPSVISQQMSGVEFGIIEKGEVEIELALGPRLGPGDVGDEHSHISGLYSPKYQGLPMSILSAEDGVSRSMWEGVIDTMALGDTLRVKGISVPIGLFETTLPEITVTDAWLAEMGLTVRPTIDLGASIPDVYGNCPRVRAIYVRDDVLTNTYHYILCRGNKSVPNLYRSIANNARSDSTMLSLVTASEYTITRTLYPGFTAALFTTRQVTGDSLHTLYADLAVSNKEIIGVNDIPKFGMSTLSDMQRDLPRNAARILRQLLVDRKQPVRTASFDRAEDICAEYGLYLDFAIQDPTQLQDVVTQILQIWDMTLTQTPGGWALSVDERPTQITFNLDEGNVEIPTSILIGAREQRHNMLNAVSEVRIRCLPDLLESSSDARWLFTATRTISTAPHATPYELLCPQIRDTRLADRVCDRIAKRLKVRSEQLSITAPYETRIAMRSLISVTSERLNLRESIWIVLGIERAVGDKATYALQRWGPDPYVYEEQSLPDVDLLLGTFEDFSRVPPPPIVSLSFPAGAEFAGPGYITVRFTTPVTENYSHALPRYRKTGSVIWVQGGGPIYARGTVDAMIRGLDPAETYEFSVQSVNKWGLVS